MHHLYPCSHLHVMHTRACRLPGVAVWAIWPCLWVSFTATATGRPACAVDHDWPEIAPPLYPFPLASRLRHPCKLDLLLSWGSPHRVLKFCWSKALKLWNCRALSRWNASHAGWILRTLRIWWNRALTDPYQRRRWHEHMHVLQRGALNTWCVTSHAWQVVEIPGAGHHLQMDQPKLFAEAVCRLVRASPTPPTTWTTALITLVLWCWINEDTRSECTVVWSVNSYQSIKNLIIVNEKISIILETFYD